MEKLCDNNQSAWVCPGLFSISVIKALAKSNVGRKRFISHHSHHGGSQDRTQGTAIMEGSQDRTQGTAIMEGVRTGLKAQPSWRGVRTGLKAQPSWRESRQDSRHSHHGGSQDRTQGRN
jgi:hypothetical protein